MSNCWLNDLLGSLRVVVLGARILPEDWLFDLVGNALNAFDYSWSFDYIFLELFFDFIWQQLFFALPTTQLLIVKLWKHIFFVNHFTSYAVWRLMIDSNLLTLFRCAKITWRDLSYILWSLLLNRFETAFL